MNPSPNQVFSLLIGRTQKNSLTDEEIKDYYFYVCLTKKDDSVEITKKK